MPRLPASHARIGQGTARKSPVHGAGAWLPPHLRQPLTHPSDLVCFARKGLHQLGRPRGRMSLQLAPLGPVVGLVVMIHVAQQHVIRRPVDDQPQIPAGPHRPEVLVFGLVQPMKTHPQIRRIQLQIKGRRLHQLLLVTRQPCQTVGKRVGNAEFHQQTAH